MANRNKRFMVIVILCAASASVDVFSCITTLVNDSGNEMRILNKNDEKFIDIPKKKRRRLEQHAHFVTYTRQPNTKTQIFNPEYECQQNECGSSGNIELKFSDIQNGTGQASLFTIIKHEPHPSMVHELPMIRKKSCHSCNTE